MTSLLKLISNAIKTHFCKNLIFLKKEKNVVISLKNVFLVEISLRTIQGIVSKHNINQNFNKFTWNRLFGKLSIFLKINKIDFDLFMNFEYF